MKFKHLGVIKYVASLHLVTMKARKIKCFEELLF